MRTQAIDRLQAFGIKPSLQRIAIMEYLMNHPVHPTVDTIFNDLYPAIPTLSKTTVYNTLKLLSEQGAISAIHIDEKNVRYDADISLHAHFKCKRCGCMFDLPVKGFDSIRIEHAGDLLITESHLYYKGYCERCKGETTQENAN
jgi:Fur family ferric uptake transcriptional regulator/Fur family peroxide stress response transcriptional regulator